MRIVSYGCDDVDSSSYEFLLCLFAGLAVFVCDNSFFLQCNTNLPSYILKPQSNFGTIHHHYMAMFYLLFCIFVWTISNCVKKVMLEALRTEYLEKGRVVFVWSFNLTNDHYLISCLVWCVTRNVSLGSAANKLSLLAVIPLAVWRSE